MRYYRETTDKDTARMIRAQNMIEHGVTIEQENGKVFYVQSANTPDKYKVQYKKGAWTCECPDFQQRHIYCKHIYAVHFTQQVKAHIISELPISQQHTAAVEHELKCQCGSHKLIKNGTRKTKTGNKTRILCKECGRTFTLSEHGFEKMQSTSLVVTAALDLYFNGQSYRKIADHLDQIHNCKIHYTTVYYWVKKFSRLISDYTEQLQPELGGMWHADEMAIKTKREGWAWLWHMIDADTKYMIANLITQQRTDDDATSFFHRAREHSDDRPELLITDGLHSYNPAFDHGFFSNRRGSEHVRSHGIRNRVNNNRVERLNNTYRERDKVMRGFQNRATALQFNSGYKTFYNHIRRHKALNGKTPAQAAGIDLHLDRNRWKSIIQKSIQ